MKWYKYNIEKMTPSEYNQWYSQMSYEKQVKTNSLIFETAKKQTVAADMLARKSISEEFGIMPCDIVFKLTETGKPYIENLNISFNISHSGNIVVCAINESPIGIDVEQIRPINLAISKKVFTDEEMLYVFKKTPTPKDFKFSNETELLNRFFETWTLKEAYCKWTGKGISSINSVDLSKVNKETYFENDYCISIVYNK